MCAPWRAFRAARRRPSSEFEPRDPSRALSTNGAVVVVEKTDAPFAKPHVPAPIFRDREVSRKDVPKKSGMCTCARTSGLRAFANCPDTTSLHNVRAPRLAATSFLPDGARPRPWVITFTAVNSYFTGRWEHPTPRIAAP